MSSVEFSWDSGRALWWLNVPFLGEFTLQTGPLTSGWELKLDDRLVKRIPTIRYVSAIDTAKCFIAARLREALAAVEGGGDE